jgi:DNA-binding winged helix-turn-helix (wHTH) protein
MSNETKELYEFGGFRLVVDERLLLNSDGTRVLLTEKAFATLCALVQKSGSLLRKEDLLEAVWDGAFVEENNIDKNISALRRALGENRKKTVFIETVRKHGYRFVAKVVRVENKKEFPPENIAANNLPPAVAAKISDVHPDAARQRNNVLAIADWQPERGTETAGNLPAQTDVKTALHVVPPVAPAAVRRGWSSKYIADWLILFHIFCCCVATRSSKYIAGWLIVSALLVGGLAFSINRVFDSKARNSPNSFERIKFRKVVGSDGSHDPTISPDGKTAVYRYANGTIWLENLTTGSRIQSRLTAARRRN